MNIAQHNSRPSSGRQQYNADLVHTGSASRHSSLSNKKHSRHNNGDGEGNGRNSVLRVPQYTLNDVKFVEELGEGAFGKLFESIFARFKYSVTKAFSKF